MARPRYGAAKRAREIRKQEERARKLARKHGKAAGKAADAQTAEGAPAPADAQAGTEPDVLVAVTTPEDAPQP
jgi:hypothetical protein